MRLRSTPRDTRRADRRLIGRDHPATELEVVRAEGSFVWDARGRRYLDFKMGWCCGNLGWGRRELRERLARFAGPDYVDPGCLYAPWAECAARLARLAPRGLERTYRAATGTEAVECALQIARAYTGRDKLLGLEGSYHGNSIAVKELIKRRIPAPVDEDVADRLETHLKKRDVAAFILEPVITALGVVIPDPEFMRRARELCTRYGTLLVADEVACGFGRSGRMFGVEHFDLEPDVMCVAKALTNGCAPLAAAITTAEIGDAIAGELDFYSTFGWHPRSVEATIATLAYWEEHGDDVLANVAARSAQARRRLPAARIVGLAIAAPVDEPDEVVEACRKHGLLLDADDDAVLMFPSLLVSEDELAAGLEVLAECASS